MDEYIELTANEFASLFAPVMKPVDEFVLRDFVIHGINRSNTRKRVIALCAKQFTPEEMALLLAKEYKGGYGIVYCDNTHYSGMYGKTGLWLTEGFDYVTYDESNTSFITWTDLAEFVQELVRVGTYATIDEYDDAGHFEHMELSEYLMLMYRDIDDGYKDMLPTLRDIYNTKRGFPDMEEELSLVLADDIKRERLYNELYNFTEMYNADHSILGFTHIYSPNELLNRVGWLSRNDWDFSMLRTVRMHQFDSVPETFITYDEIYNTLGRGSNVQGGKARIYNFFMNHDGVDECAAFLKNEYGTGGSSHALSGADHSWMGYNSRGITLKKNGCNKELLLDWTSVAVMIGDMICNNTYMSGDDLMKCEDIEEMAVDELLQYAS